MEQEQENNNNNRQAVETRIVGGNQAEKDEYPFMGKCFMFSVVSVETYEQKGF